MNKNITTPLLILVFIFSVCFADALIASISNPRMVLYQNMTGKVLEFNNSVIVNNENNESVSISVNPVGELKDIITVPNNNFTLLAGERREVIYNIRITKPGLYQGDVLVSFKMNGYQNTLSAAQKIVISVKKDNTMSDLQKIIIAIVAIIAVVALIIISRLIIMKRRKLK